MDTYCLKEIKIQVRRTLRFRILSNNKYSSLVFIAEPAGIELIHFELGFRIQPPVLLLIDTAASEKSMKRCQHHAFEGITEAKPWQIFLLRVNLLDCFFPLHIIIFFKSLIHFNWRVSCYPLNVSIGK